MKMCAAAQCCRLRARRSALVDAEGLGEPIPPWIIFYIESGTDVSTTVSAWLYTAASVLSTLVVLLDDGPLMTPASLYRTTVHSTC